MFPVDRTISRREFLDGTGNPCALVSKHISVTAGFRIGGLGATYRRPIAVERGADIAPITDVVMVTKLAGLPAVTLAMIVGAIRRWAQSNINRAGAGAEGLMAKLFGEAAPATVFSQPYQVGDDVVFTAAAWERMGGFGFGGGSDTSITAVGEPVVAAFLRAAPWRSSGSLFRVPR